MPGKGKDRSVTASELLDHASENVATRFRGQPLAEASVRMALAQAYQGLLDARAEPHAARAAELRTRHLGPEHPETLQALAQQAASLLSQGEAADAADETRRLARDRWEAGASLARRVLAARRRMLGPSHPETLRSQAFLAYNLLCLSRFDDALAREARSQAEQAEAVALRAFGPDHTTTFDVWHSLGLVLAECGEPERGQALLRRVVAGRERLLGPLAPDTVRALQHLAHVLRKDGRLDEARRAYLVAVDRHARLYGVSHVAGSYSRRMLVWVLRKQGDHAAIREVRQAWLRAVLALPREPDPYLRSRHARMLAENALGLAMLPRSVVVDTGLTVRGAEEAVSRSGEDEGVWTALAAVYDRLGRHDDALRTMRAAITRPGWKGDAAAWLVLAAVHTHRGELDQARVWYDRYRAYVEEVGYGSLNRAGYRPLREEVDALLGDRG